MGVIISGIIYLMATVVAFGLFMVLRVRKLSNARDYAKAWKLLKKFKFIIATDGQGIISMEYASVLALKAGDTNAAIYYLERAMKYGAYPIDYFILMIISAIQNNWQRVEETRSVMYGMARSANEADKTDWQYLDTLLAQRNSFELLELIFTENFNVMIDRRIDLQAADH